MKLPASKTEIEARAFLLAECYETAEDYLKITKPYIEKNAPSNQVISIYKNFYLLIQWIYNILDGVAEKEDVVMNNEDFVLVRVSRDHPSPFYLYILAMELGQKVQTATFVYCSIQSIRSQVNTRFNLC